VPTRAARVRLSARTVDAAGVPVARLEGSQHPEDIRTAALLAAKSEAWLQEAGAHATWRIPAHAPALSGGQRQADPARMAETSAAGAADPNGRVWGAERIYEEDLVNSQPEPERFARATHPVTGFELAGTAVGADLPAEPAWLPAVVPGGVHESLLAAGLIKDPYVDRNETFVRWIEDRDWWFRAAFTAPTYLAPDERLRLICHGLDTVAALWLNGEPLGEHVNMFRPAIFDLTGQSRSRNELLIRFSPPLAGIDPPEPATRLAAALPDIFAGLAAEQPTDSEAAPELPIMFSGTLARATLRRKATFSWGWDFGPRVPSIGIWRPVELVRDQPGDRKRQILSAVRSAHLGRSKLASVNAAHVLVTLTELAVDSHLELLVLSMQAMD
jgi:hypothetical protein